MYDSSISVESSLMDSYAWDTIVSWMESEISGIATNSTKYGNYINSNFLLTDSLYAIYKYNWTTSILINPSEYKKGTIEIPARSRTEEQTLYEIATGSTENTKVLNIYDMAGNVWEWRTEEGNNDSKTGISKYAILRGGAHFYGGYPISARHGYYLSDSGAGFDIGFRVVLYIK